jgi:type I restriction enzyme S subunit
MSEGRQPYHILQWGSLSRWDLKSARAAAFRTAHPSFRPLGEFIEDATDLVHPYREPSRHWPVFGVTNKGGVGFSHFQSGSAFNSAYKRIKQDWFFHNPTRANVGSLGRVPEVPEDAITSPEYQVWRIKEGLLPTFLEILIRLPLFLSLIEYHRVGAVKERLFLENLCEIPIPVLSVQQQRMVIRQWDQAQAEIAAALERAERRYANIDKEFFADLGLSSPNTVPMCRAFSVW